MSYIVENITSKEVTTKFGPKPAYSIVANGERFSYGFKKPAFKIGDEIDFQFSENTYGKTVDMTSVQLISKGTGSPTPPPATATTAPPKAYGAPAKVFPIPPLHGDRAIVRQNSITNATKFYCGTTDYKEVADYLATAEIIIEIARKFEAYSCGDLDMQAAEEMVKGE
jgi:hypothetical protein